MEENSLPQTSDELQQAARLILENPVDVNATEKQTTFYAWAPADGHTDDHIHGRYTGEVELDLEEGAELPPFVSKWKPHEPAEGNVVYFDGTGWFQAKETFNIEAARRYVLSVRADSFEFQLQQKYPSFEQDSWTKQEADARAYLDTGKASTFFETLFIMRDNDDEDMKTFAESIVKNAEAYHEAYAMHLAEMQKLRAQLKDVTSLGDFVKLSGIPPRQFFTL